MDVKNDLSKKWYKIRHFSYLYHRYKEPLIKLQKVKTDSKTEFKFIVDITNEDGDDFRFRSINQ